MQKSFTVNFYRLHHGIDDESGSSLSDLLKQNPVGHEVLTINNTIGLKIIERDIDYCFGEIKQYRDEAPHIGIPSGNDRPIQLQNDEHVIEKSYMLYSFAFHSVLLQITAFCRSPQRLCAILNDQRPAHTVFYSNIIQSDALERLMNLQDDIREIECSVTLPSEILDMPSDEWKRAALTLAAGSVGRLRFSLLGKNRGTNKQSLEPSVVRNVIDGVRSGFLASARAQPLDGEVIDLLQDRLSSKIRPTMAGKYPLQESVLSELKRALDENSPDLRQYQSQ